MSMFWVWVIVGIVAGWLAKGVMHEGPYGILGDLIVGVIGAFIGGWIFNYFGHPGVTGLNLGSLVVAFVGAVVFLWIVRQLSRGRARM